MNNIKNIGKWCKKQKKVAWAGPSYSFQLPCNVGGLQRWEQAWRAATVENAAVEKATDPQNTRSRASVSGALNHMDYVVFGDPEDGSRHWGLRFAPRSSSGCSPKQVQSQALLELQRRRRHCCSCHVGTAHPCTTTTQLPLSHVSTTFRGKNKKWEQLRMMTKCPKHNVFRYHAIHYNEHILMYAYDYFAAQTIITINGSTTLVNCLL